jgi:hypothetical protein
MNGIPVLHFVRKHQKGSGHGGWAEMVYHDHQLMMSLAGPLERTHLHMGGSEPQVGFCLIARPKVKLGKTQNPLS